MTSPRYARIAAKVLAREAAPPVGGDRRAAIASIERALREKGKRRAQQRWLLGALGVAAAAAIALGLFARRPQAALLPLAHGPAIAIATFAEEPPHARGTGEAEVTPPRAIRGGSRVVARRGRAFLAFATGEHLVVDDGGDMTIVEPRVLQLDGGSMQASLGPEERLRVRTPDAQIEAQGASFRVSVGRACEGTTRVDVARGAVVVHRDGHEVKVEGTWPVCSTKPVPKATSSLVEQNDMFAEAIAAKRSGQAALAVARFERFLATYPRSALAESATVERMKLLAALEPARGAAAARIYLAAYPHGFARAEAEALAR